jgi:hypothetical protein
MQMANVSVPAPRRQTFWLDAFRNWVRSLKSSPSAPAEAAPVRVLRWVFSRDFDNVTCELTLASDERFELRMVPPYPTQADAMRRFSQVNDALQRQCEIEAALINDGWTLELHESRLSPISPSGTFIERV